MAQPASHKGFGKHNSPPFLILIRSGLILNVRMLEACL